MYTKFKIIFMLFAIAAIWLATGAALTGCATSPPPPVEIRQTVEVKSDDATRVVTGPARGHWNEDNGNNVIFYTVAGRDCTWLAKRLDEPAVESSGPIVLPRGQSLCMLPLRSNQAQYVTIHARRP